MEEYQYTFRIDFGDMGEQRAYHVCTPSDAEQMAYLLQQKWRVVFPDRRVCVSWSRSLTQTAQTQPPPEGQQAIWEQQYITQATSMRRLG